LPEPASGVSAQEAAGEAGMRLLMAMLLGALVWSLAGCDKASSPAEQAQPATAAGTEIQPVASAPKGSNQEDISLQSKNGMTALLSYAFAGQAAPQATFTGADGRDVHLSDFSGRPLLVNIWATWCAPCKVEMPTLDRLSALEEGNISVIAVSQDLQGRKPVLAFFAENGFENLEPYTDSDNQLLGSFGGNLKLPTTILYNASGTEVWRVEGGVEWDDAEMTKLIAEAKS
jgi:thiol-disulfide isomerase/thioredoxin